MYIWKARRSRRRVSEQEQKVRRSRCTSVMCQSGSFGGQDDVFLSQSGRLGGQDEVCLSQSGRLGGHDEVLLSQTRRLGGQRCNVSKSE